MKQIIVNVGGLTIAEKKLVNKALAKIKNIGMCDPMRGDKTDVMYGPSIDRVNVGFDYHKRANPTHTPQQVLEMAGMAEQGHVHAESMALYAEDAKTHAEPWKLWQIRTGSFDWIDCKFSPSWDSFCEYRRKQKTHTVNGVEVPDLRVSPEYGDYYYLADPTERDFTYYYLFHGDGKDSLWAKRGLIYPDTEEGKQAAILHSKAMLGIV